MDEEIKKAIMENLSVELLMSHSLSGRWIEVRLVYDGQTISEDRVPADI